MKGFKKPIAFILVLCLTLTSFSITAIAEESGKLFSDVTSDKNYAVPVETLAKLDIIMGYPDGTFGAQRDITRTEVAAIALRIKGLEQASQNLKGTTRYTDIPSNFWGSGYINKATEVGIIVGDGDGKFRPDDNIKLEEAIRIISVVTGYEQEAISKGVWPDGYISLASEKGILSKITHSKGEAVNRSEVAQIAYQLITSRSVIASPSGGTYTGTQRIGLTPTVVGSKIYYTLDGSEPTISSKEYIDTFYVASSGTLKAIAVKGSLVIGNIVTEKYIISQATNTSSAGSGGSSNYPVIPLPTPEDTGNSSLKIEFNTDNFLPLKEDETNNTYIINDIIGEITGQVLYETEIKSISISVKAGYLTLDNQTLLVSKNWVYANPRLVLGKNTIIATVTDVFGNTNSATIILQNINEENSRDLNLDTNDTDGDGILNWEEEAFGTDPTKSDTDGDGISDYNEIVDLGTDPNKVDTNGNGVSDYDEDADNDTLTNGFEYSVSLDPLAPDSDFDGLNDAEEMYVYKTDPLSYDTDNDGASDKWEIDNNFDPLVANTSFAFVMTVNTDDTTKASVAIDIRGDQVESLEISTVTSDPLLNSKIPGFISNAIDLTTDSDISNATVSFEFDEVLLGDNNFEPAIYYFSEDTQLLEELSTVISGNVASTTVLHFSKYILLNKKAFDEVWNQEIPDHTTSDSALNVVLVIDSSGSMSTNDPKRLRVAAAERFVDAMGSNDRVAVVDFDDTYRVFQDFTTDHDLLYAAIERSDQSGGTSLSAGIGGALGLFDSEGYLDTSRLRYIIMLTDGDGSYNNSYTQYAAEHGVVIYTIGLGSGVRPTVLQAIASGTGGKYFFASEADDLLPIYTDVGNDINTGLDENKDGIPDELAKLICEGIIRTGAGINPFDGKTYEQVQENNDLDGDGLINGEEIEVIYIPDSGKAYIIVHSYPNNENSDGDAYDDYQEVKTYTTNPLRYNISLQKNDLDWLTDDENFVSDSYKDGYDNAWIGWTKKFGVWFGKTVFGDGQSRVYMYKIALKDYFEELARTQELNDKRALAEDIIKFLDAFGEGIDNLAEISELEDTLDFIRVTKIQLQLWIQGDNFSMLTDEYLITIIERLQVVVPRHPTLQNIKWLPKLSKTLSVANGVLAFVDLGLNVEDIYKDIKAFSSFASQTNAIKGYEVVLDDIASRTSDVKLKTACLEIKKIFEEQITSSWDSVLNNAFGLTKTIVFGTASVIGALAALGLVTGGVTTLVAGIIAAVGAVISGVDFIFNWGDQAEACIYLYGAATSASMLGLAFVDLENSSLIKNSYVIVYDREKIYNYQGLVGIRQFSEEKMIEANEAHRWFDEWIFNFAYSKTDAENNIGKCSLIMFKYK